MLTQNSAKCLDVLEFSARNVGPNVYTCNVIHIRNSDTCYKENLAHNHSSSELLHLRERLHKFLH